MCIQMCTIELRSEFETLEIICHIAIYLKIEKNQSIKKQALKLQTKL